MILFDTYDVRDYHPDDAAALFVVAAAIEPLDAGQLVAWTEAVSYTHLTLPTSDLV